MIDVIIDRIIQDDVQTLGVLQALYNRKLFRCFTIERGWNNNERRISCIPDGEYLVSKEWSNRFRQDLYEVKGVEGRSEIKFHTANYSRQLEGCIGLGKYIGFVDSDANLDVVNSALTMNQFHAFLEDEKEFKLTIR